MKQQSPWQKMKQLALWKWGLICIFAGLATTSLTQFYLPPVRDRAAALGRACGSLVFVVIGIVLIAVDLVKRMRRR
jgi:energy-converting hydrogenase Eha subunit C